MEPEDVPGYHWPADRRAPDPERRAAVEEWTAALAERGWVAPHWPRELGGAGLTVLEQVVLSEELARARVPVVGGIGVSMLGPTLIAHGSEAQQREHLPKILSGEVAWAQGFSEPAAGSDLAALSTTAALEGDEYVVRGQKIWTSVAQHADWLCLLVRTDSAERRHRGLSFLLVDASTPGVTVRPIEDLTGSHPINEIFLDDARVPVANRVGEDGRGWYVAMSMLDFERSGIVAAVAISELLGDLVRCIRSAVEAPRGGVRPDAWPAQRAAIADRHVEAAVLYELARRTVSMQAAGELPNHEASVNQLVRAELHQRVALTATHAFGLYANLWRSERWPAIASFTREYARSTAQTVMSGTPEIQRNLIATRGLGLPRA